MKSLLMNAIKNCNPNIVDRILTYDCYKQYLSINLLSGITISYDMKNVILKHLNY
jgi:hypothetical protein